MTTVRPFVGDDADADASAEKNAAATAAAALAAARAWTAFLASQPPPAPSVAAFSLLRPLAVSKLVHEQWKSSGEEASAWFDGRVAALEAFVSEAVVFSYPPDDDHGENSPRGSSIDIIRNGKQLNAHSGISALFAAQRLLSGPRQRPTLLLGAADEWRCSQLWCQKNEKKTSSCCCPDWDAFASSFPDGEQARMTDGRRKGARPDVRQKGWEVTEAAKLLRGGSRKREKAKPPTARPELR